MDQRHVGRVCWAVLHSLAEILDASGVSWSTRRARLGRLVLQGIGSVFPCSICRGHILERWPVFDAGYSGPKSAAAMLRDFHILVSKKVETDEKSPWPRPTLPASDRYTKLLPDRAWLVYLAAFLYYIAVNCENMCSTIQATHPRGCNHTRVVMGRIADFVRNVRDIDPTVPELVFRREATCEGVFASVWDYEERLMPMKRHVFAPTIAETKRVFLRSNVSSRLYKPHAPPAGSLCGRCRGACEKYCDRMIA